MAGMLNVQVLKETSLNIATETRVVAHSLTEIASRILFRFSKSNPKEKNKEDANEGC